jgi:uncharacterized protein
MSAPSGRLLPLAVVGEGALALAGGLWIYAAGLPVRAGDPGMAIAAGLGVALGLAFAQWYLQRYAPRVGPVEHLRELQRTVFAPLFGSLTTAELVAISALAGIGEEIFFRGAMQPALGWLPATVAFGVCHIGLTRRSWALGVWALIAGAGLAALFEVTGGLLAPIVAHAVYDLAALFWIRNEARRAQPIR